MTTIENFANDERLLRHDRISNKFLPEKEQYGYYAIHSLSSQKSKVSEDRMKDTFLNIKLIYSESLSYADVPVAHQDGFTRAYKPKKPSGEKVTSQITSCYFDGHIATDGYIDVFCEGNDGFNPYWFIYKIQRHLQLTKEVLEGISDEVVCIIRFSNIEEFKWEIFRSHRLFDKKPYVAYHHDIFKAVKLSSVYGRGDKWNITMDIAKRLMKQVARIFGMDDFPQPYWNEDGELEYSLGMPGR